MNFKRAILTFFAKRLIFEIFPLNAFPTFSILLKKIDINLKVHERVSKDEPSM